jgi:ribosomal protein L37E
MRGLICRQCGERTWQPATNPSFEALGAWEDECVNCGYREIHGLDSYLDWPDEAQRSTSLRELDD